MLFCPKCGGIMLPKQEKNKKVMVCSKCGTKHHLEEHTIKETVAKSDDVPVIDKEIETLPLTDAICPKCGHKKAFYWTRQMRALDEPETKFFKCEKCKNIWRDSS